MHNLSSKYPINMSRKLSITYPISRLLTIQRSLLLDTSTHSGWGPPLLRVKDASTKMFCPAVIRYSDMGLFNLYLINFNITSLHSIRQIKDNSSGFWAEWKHTQIETRPKPNWTDELADCAGRWVAGCNAMEGTVLCACAISPSCHGDRLRDLDRCADDTGFRLK